MAKGLTVSVYRPADHGDCTNGGASSKVAQFTVTGIGVDGRKIDEIFEPTDKAPEAQIVPHPTVKDYFYLVPLELIESNKWVMFGGNLAYCSDSRIQKAFGGHALKIHDRVEEYR